MVIHRVGGRCLHPLDEEILPGNRPDNTELGGPAPKSSLNMLAADSGVVIEVDARDPPPKEKRLVEALLRAISSRRYGAIRSLRNRSSERANRDRKETI